MTGRKQPGSDDTERPSKRRIVTLENIRSVEFEAPIDGTDRVDCVPLGWLYEEACSAETKAGNTVAADVFQLLWSVCHIRFKPFDRAEPYGPMTVFDGMRSVIPSDLRGEQSEVFADLAPETRNPGLRARLADIAWLNDHKQVESARLAIASYCESVQCVLDGKAHLHLEEQNAASRNACDNLRRACQISTTTGWKESEAPVLTALVNTIGEGAVENGDCNGYLHIGELCLDYGIADAAAVANNAETLAATEKLDPYLSQKLWKLAARGYRLAKQPNANNRARANAAECHVTMAAAADYKGMVATSCLMEAIKALRQVPNTRKRRDELEALLRQAQATIGDEMGAVSIGVDIGDLTDHAREDVAGKTLAEALGVFASLEESPEPEMLREDVEKQAVENPLSSVYSTMIVDDEGEGKIVSNSPGLGLGERNDDVAVRHSISCNEGWRRQLAVSGTLEPARHQIMAEHPLDQYRLVPIAALSPFAPADRADIYALGFARYFNGDFISALHILVPQLENSLRYILKQTGEDVSKIQNDMTQENPTLPVMLDKNHEALERIFGEAIIFEIDNLFLFRGGLALRHKVAHGMISDSACYSPDAIYACWFIFRLCCLPLFPYWQKVMDALDGEEIRTGA